MSETLADRIDTRASATPDALLAIDEQGRRTSFAEYRDAVLRCAAGLAERGVGPGTPVSWMLPTWIESLVLVGALARLGAVQNPILPIYREREVGFILDQLEPRLLIVPGEWRGFDYAAMAHGLCAAHPGCDVMVQERGRALPDAAPQASTPIDDADATEPPVRWVFYTSGTTADPKGARHTDASLSAASECMCAALDLGADDRIAMVFPFTHVGGIGWLFSALQVGCALVVVERFDPDESIDLLAKHGVTQATAGTVFHQAYLAAQRARGAERLFPAVRAFPGGGAPKPPALHRAIKAEMGGAGIVSGWGMTECPIITMNTVHETDDEKLATTEGRPCPEGMQVRVVRLDGTPAFPGEEGELHVRGPQLCRGYLDTALDAEAFGDDGWLRTGDLGRLDSAGYVSITGRLKDVIIRKGENISAREVEDLLHEHPDVAEAALIGLPDPASGELACAVVAPRPNVDAPSLAALTGFLRDRGLAAHKLPERLEIVPTLPRNPSGKVLKHQLRQGR